MVTVKKKKPKKGRGDLKNLSHVRDGGVWFWGTASRYTTVVSGAGNGRLRGRRWGGGGGEQQRGHGGKRGTKLGSEMGGAQLGVKESLS